MKRFSLVHELGPLMIQDLSEFSESRVSTHIDMDITRNLMLTEGKQVMTSVTFEVILETESKITTDELKTAIRNELSILNDVFSRISLAISQTTNLSPFGPIVTMPAYEKEKVIINVAN